MTAPSVVEPEQFARAEVPLVPTERVVDCPLCQGDAADCFAEGYDYELESCRNRWRFVQCRRCGHLWLDPRPAVEALGVIYPSHYYAYDFAHRIHPIALRGKAWLDARRLAAIRRRLARPPTTYLDVGCGDGRFLRAMERLGIPRDLLFGLELDHRIATRLREEGYQVECARVETSTLVADASLDLITMFHVIEHLATPVETVAKLARWLRPGGILALETPNRSSLDARLFRRTFWGGYHFPRHWHLFDAAGVVGLIRQAGLRPVGVRYQTGHSFWLYSIHHWLRYGPWRMPRLARAFDPIGALVPLVIATGFDKVRAAMGFPTSAVLVMGQKPGPA